MKRISQETAKGWKDGIKRNRHEFKNDGLMEAVEADDPCQTANTWKRRMLLRSYTLEQTAGEWKGKK